MTLKEIILASPTLDEDLVVYAKKVGGQFDESSESVLLDLTEDEREMKIDEVARNKMSWFQLLS